MYALFWLLPITLLAAGGALIVFLWCARSGQFNDLEGAAWRILQGDEARPASRRKTKNGEG